MKRLLVAARVVALAALFTPALTACGTVTGVQTDISSAFSSVTSAFSSVTSAAADAAGWITGSNTLQASSVYGAEGIYKFLDNQMTNAVNAHAVSIPEAQRIGAIDNKVYAVLVPMRTASENGQSSVVAGLLATFNDADHIGALTAALSADGIGVTPATPIPQVPPS